MDSPGLFLHARSLFLSGGLNWLAATPLWKVVLLTPDYVVNLATQQTVASLLPVQAISTSGDILGRTVVDGYARATSVTTIGGNIGQEVSQMVITCGDVLVWWSDNSIDFPYIADGGEAIVLWDPVALGPFQL